MTATDQLDTIFTALSNKKRRGIIHELSLSPSTIAQLAGVYGLSLPAIHKHMKVLEEAKLINRKKAGRTNFVALNKESLSLAQKWIMQYRTEWGNNTETLENYIARMSE